MFQRPPSFSRNCISAPGRSGNSNRHSRSCAHVGRVAAHHVAHVQLGHLVVGEVDRLVAGRASSCARQRRAILPRLRGDADEDVRLLRGRSAGS